MTLCSEPGSPDSLAEAVVLAACELADAGSVGQWSAGAIEDVASAMEVLAGALAALDPETAELVAVVPVAVAAVLEHVEHDRGEVPALSREDARTAASTPTALRQALATHGIAQHHVHQLGPRLVTVTLEPADAQALAVLLGSRGNRLSQTLPRDEDDRWGSGPAETAAAALTRALAAHGAGTYARVLASGQVSAGLTPKAAQSVVDELRSSPAPRARRRGLGPGYKGLRTL